MKRNVTIWTIIILMVTLGMSYGQTYSEDFEDGVVSDWQQYRANEEMIQAIDMASAPAVLVGGDEKVGYIQDVNATYRGAAILLMGDTQDADYIFEADVYVYENHSGGSAYTGLVAYGDSSKGYYVKLVADFDSDNRFRLYNNQLNMSTFAYTFYAEPPTADVDKSEGWHHMKIAAWTNPNNGHVSYQCWYDEIDLGTYIDDAAGHNTSGQPGVYAFQMDSDGIAGYFDNFTVEPGSATSINDFQSQPVAMTLEQNFPNPFNPSTMISFDIQEGGIADLRIYNIKGELISTLASGHIQPGSYSLTWDGKSDQGQTVASGAYIVVLSRGSEQLSRNMLMIK